MINKEINIIISCLIRDKESRKIMTKNTMVVMWTKLESLYFNKSLAHKLHMKHLLYYFNDRVKIHNGAIDGIQLNL